MHTTIVYYLLKKKSQLNEACLGHKVRYTVYQMEDTCTITYDI